ncbi:hypothetical protein VSU19_10865 [Verrucomicrobiales bacterium BCK34]|nr:hypothetical protein [Verrucomicrobiales bacterium BCK34]
MLPKVSEFKSDAFSTFERSVLLVSEGFEHRSLAFSQAIPKGTSFEQIVIFVNEPARASRLQELESKLANFTSNEILQITFHRNDPEECEQAVRSLLTNRLYNASDFVVDISVFSRLLILILFNILAVIEKRVRVIYTEPEDYNPSKEDFEESVQQRPVDLVAFSSAGLKNVLRTSGLSSSVMIGQPTALVAFVSFNAHLISGLLHSLSPARLLLVGVSPPRLGWRAAASAQIHESIIDDYSRDNPQNELGELERASSSLDYQDTIRVLAEIYREFCFTHRLVLAPTGSKMQALGAALFRAICPDVHIEYPMPEKYFHEGFSSKEIHKIHVIDFKSLSRTITDIERCFQLDGSWDDVFKEEKFVAPRSVDLGSTKNF